MKSSLTVFESVKSLKNYFQRQRVLITDEIVGEKSITNTFTILLSFHTFIFLFQKIHRPGYFSCLQHSFFKVSFEKLEKIQWGQLSGMFSCLLTDTWHPVWRKEGNIMMHNIQLRSPPTVLNKSLKISKEKSHFSA